MKLSFTQSSNTVVHISSSTVLLLPDDAIAKTVFFAEIQFQKDDDLYHRFFCETFLYLYRNRTLYTDWQGVVIFPSRSLEPENTTVHRTLLASTQVQRIYLDELPHADHQPIGIRLMQLTIAPESDAIAQARELIERVQQEAPTSPLKTEIIDIITTIAVYKFANLSREDVEAMLGLKLEETRVYQEAKAEGREEGREEGRKEDREKVIRNLLRREFSLEEIAEIVELTVQEIQQISQQLSS